MWLKDLPQHLNHFKMRLRDLTFAGYENKNPLEDLQVLLPELQSGATSHREEMEGLIQICQTDNVCFELSEDECTELALFYTVNLATAFGNYARHLVGCEQFAAQINSLINDDSSMCQGRCAQQNTRDSRRKMTTGVVTSAPVIKGSNPAGPAISKPLVPDPDELPLHRKVSETDQH